jgi:hypothetical protein
MLNDPIMIDRYHCETVEAVVVSYPNAWIRGYTWSPFAAWSVNQFLNTGDRVEDPHRRSRDNFKGMYSTLLAIEFFFEYAFA